MKILKFLFFVLLFYKFNLPYAKFKNLSNSSANIIKSKTSSRFENRENLKNAVFCLKNFFNHTLIKTYPISFYIPNIKDSKILEYNLIIKNLIEPDIPIHLLTGHLDLNMIYSSNLYAIIMIDKPGTLETDTKPELLYLCTENCLLYIVIISKPYFNQESFLADSSYLIQILWKRKLHKVVITGLINDEFWFAKSTEFRSNESCIPAEPKIIGSSCVSSIVYNNMSDLMFRELEFNNCIMKTSYIDYPPYSFLLDDEKVSGFDVFLLDEFSSYFNFQMHYRRMTTNNDTDSRVAILLEIRYGSQFVVGGINWDPQEEVAYLLPYDVS